MSETTAHEAALGRLMASRARIAGLLLPAPPQDRDAAAADPGAQGAWAAPRRWRAQWRLWKRQGPLAPVLMAIEHGLGSWWRRHPWHDTATVVGEMGAATVRPLIRRHPMAAIGLGAAVGAALAWSQPWRWRPLRVHATRGTRQAFGWALGQLSQPAVQMLIAGLLLSKASPAAPTTEPDPMS